MGERPPVLIGERVFWLGSGSGLPKSGKVKWIGRLAEMGPDWAVGLELDEALPYGGIDGTWGHRKLFSCKRKHGLIVPLSSVIPQPNHIKPGEPFGRTLRNCGKTGSQELAELAPPNKPESKVGKLFRALSNDESSQRNKYEDLELPSTHLRNPNLERQLAILGTLRRSNLLEQARLEGVKSEACLYSVVLEKEENVFRERRRMIHGREFKRSDDTLDRTSSIHSSRSSGGSSRRDRTSGIFSFFRWFRKEKSEDSEGDSPPSPSSPVLRRANGSITGSVDTLFSTATTRSFAFVPPSHYRPYGAANPPEIRINPGPETNTYRNRIRQRDLLRQKEQHISLREKYRLYASETLPRSVDRINEISGAADNDSPSSSKNSTFKRQKRRAPPPPVTKSSSTSENSLPTFSTEINDGQDIGRQHRRTLSEPSPTRYIRPCHVKGKRKAPSPPNNSNASNSNNIAQSSQSDRTLSLHRKKRRAPPPPIQRSPSDEITEILQRAFEDITGSDTSLNRLETVSNASTVDISQADIVATDTLRLERGYLKPNREEKPMDLKYKPTSPVSPRPWYKRNAATRENSFSRSNERKKEREKRRVEDWMIESGIPRRSNQLPESRLNVFAKMDKTEEKRRSQISILTNISELDREAAEIVRKNKEKQQALLANKNDRFYDGGNGAMSNGYFGNVDHNQTANAAENLVSLLNSITNVTNVTLNSAFFLQDSNFREQAPKPEDHVIRRVVVDEQEIRIVDNPTPVVTEPEPEPGPSGLGKITKVTIEELDDFDKERNSRAQALYEANRLQRNQVPFIPTITEVSESTVTSPTSTVANTPSDPVAPPIPGATTPSATSPDESKALQKVPIQIPASVMKPVVHVIWNCPRCTLENPRWKVTCEACDMWRPVPCDFKEVKPKHPLPLAVLRIVEPKDQNVPGTVKITEIKDDNSSATNKVPLTNGVEAKPEGPNDKGSLNLDLKDNKSKRSSQGLTISDLLFNTQGNSSPKDSTWYKDILNGLNLPPSTTTYKEYTNNLQKKQVNAEKTFVSDKSLVSDKPLNTNKLPFNSNIPTPSASGSSISSLSSTNSEKPSTSASGQRSTKGDIVEPEEIRKARLAFFEKYGQPSTSKTPNQSTNVSSESKGEADANKTSGSVKIIEPPKVSPKSKVLVQHNSSAQNEDSKLPLNTNKLPQAENIETKTARTTTENLGKPVESRLCKSSDTKLEQSPSVKHRSISRNEESSVKDTQTTEIPYKVVLSNDQEEDKRKLREMLKEMKHSLPKRSKDDKVSQKSSNTEEISKKVTELMRTEDQVKSEIRSPKLGAIRKTTFVKPQNPTENNYKHGPSEKAEAYLVESETIVEEIKIKKPQPGKVSSAAQTSAMVRQLTPQVKPPSGKEVVVPITVEEYTIQDGVLYTSVSKKAKRIGSGTFQLMRPRDFANIEAIKTRGSGAGGAPTYANVSSEVDKPASDGGVTSKTKEVEKLSLQLTEPQGLAHFRAGLASTNDANNMNTIAVNRLLRRLESAIANGQHELAAALAKELAQLKVNCVVTRQKPETPTSQIQIDMYVEDKENHQGPFPLQMKPSATVEQLKLKVEREYEIPCDVQRWIIGKALANDDKATLESMGVTESGAAVYLYLVVPEDPALSVPQLPQNELVSKVLEGLNNLEGAVGGELPKSCNTVQEKTVITVEMPEENNGSSTHRTESDITIEEIPTPKDRITELIREEVRPARFEKQDTGWRCGRCTLVNSPGRPGCAACGSERPNEREVVVEAPKDQKKPLAIPTDDKKKEEEQPAKAIEEEKKRDYQKLVDLEKSDLIICTETFECPICIVEYQPYEGVVLRECLHVFCRACLANTVEYSDEAEVKCPFRNDKYTCDSTLLEREIKALVTPEAYEQHLAKSIALAETKIGNAFHCKTPDCKGWCIFEDNVNLFRCPVCTHTNCLTCQAVHEGMDCKEFQEQLNKDSEVNVESKRTKEMLQEMVDRGEAMNCPTCQVVLMKKWGCDWLRCSMCKTEICWITRGPRWGPNGKGDTSGGCQCGVNGIKCHPKCTYCH